MKSGLPHLSHPKYRPDIDGLRAVAVISVFTYHAFPNWLGGGFIGVDVFFVISGYLISTIIFENLDRGTFSFTEFYARRIRRIFPALLLVLAASGVFGWFALLADEYEELGKHVAAGAGFVANFVLWEEAGYFDRSAAAKPLIHLWSLGIEEQFYIVWPFLVWLASRWKAGLLGVTTLIAALSLLLSIHLVGDDAIGAFYSPLTRFWELLAGSMLARLALDKRFAPGGGTLANLFSVAGMLLLAFGLWHIGRESRFPGGLAAVPVLAAMLIIAAGPGAWVNRIILSSRPAVWFGLISFPLYLWHWPLLSFATIAENGLPGGGLRMAAVLLSVGLAWATYRFVERPFRLGSHGGVKAVVLCLLAIAAFVSGWAVYVWDGLPQRPHIAAFEAQMARFSFTRTTIRPSGAKIMLLGDSHAAHLRPGLTAELGDVVADYASGGCIPFFDVDRYDSRFAPGACRKAVNAALSEFLADEGMTGIILSSMGPVYLSGEAFKGTDAARVTGAGVTLASRPDLADRWEIYRLGMQDTLAHLSAAGKKVLFVIDVPELGFDPKSCLDDGHRPLSIRAKKRPVCAVRRAEYDQRSRRYRDLVYSVLKDYPEVRVYDPTGDFCDEEWCWAIRDGKYLYHDFDHLTDDGSLYVARRMAPFVMGLM